jgi:hypothetical protein
MSSGGLFIEVVQPDQAISNKLSDSKSTFLPNAGRRCRGSRARRRYGLQPGGRCHRLPSLRSLGPAGSRIHGQGKEREAEHSPDRLIGRWTVLAQHGTTLLDNGILVEMTVFATWSVPLERGRLDFGRGTHVIRSREVGWFGTLVPGQADRQGPDGWGRFRAESAHYVPLPTAPEPPEALKEGP